MNIVAAVLREITETLYRAFLKIRSNVYCSKKHNVHLNSLKQDGISIIPDYLSHETVTKYKGLIDKYLDSKDTNIWTDAQGADERLYFINEIDDDFKKYYETSFFRNVLKQYTGICNPVGMLLAGKIKAVPENLGSGGGWHRDSAFTHQFKSICYLSDVSSKNGPFMYIKESQNKLKILECYFKKILKVGSTRFSDSEIEDYLVKTKQEVVEVVASSGALVFADTKGIHRGKPIEEGERYVIFCYYWNSKVPQHFDKLRQK
tara:strand:+ start:11113 stop:11895 length:783 start_codon:yes stop_codon:yes gene_type:complete